MQITLDEFVSGLHEKSTADFVKTETGKTILILKNIEKIVESQMEQGKGNIFAKNWKIRDLKDSLTILNPIEGKEIYEGVLKDAGFQLVLERVDVVPYRKLIGFEAKGKVMIEDKQVEYVGIPKTLDKFKTDFVHFKIRQVEIKEAAISFEQFEDDARAGKLFILESVYPGKYQENLINKYLVTPTK
jgi:hypothetical protein